MAIRNTIALLKAQVTSLIETAATPKTTAAEIRSVLYDMIDSMRPDMSVTDTDSPKYVANQPDIPDLSDDTPLAPGTAAAGTGTAASRDDHVHPVGVTKLGDIGTITGTFSNIATGLSSGDIISISGRAQWTTETNNFYYFDWGPREFGKLVTSDDSWLTLRGSGSGQRLHLRRSGSNLQMRNANAVQNVTGEIYKWN